MTSFAGVGKWLGCAEVYSGDGVFVGNALDQRHVQQQPDGSTRIDLAFIGPIKTSGHYTIEPDGNRRLYRGPLNIGMAETLAPELVDANGFWPDMGLSQRFFLYTLPGGMRQLSLALLSRGDRLMYVVVGENEKVDTASNVVPTLIAGTEHDLRDDVNAGRARSLLHRSGHWQGETTILAGETTRAGPTEYHEHVTYSDGRVAIERSGVGPEGSGHALSLRVGGNCSWTPAAGTVTGSFSSYGGRAQTSVVYDQDSQLRGWQREVVSNDGAHKAILHFWYHGGTRVAIQFGVLAFDG